MTRFEPGADGWRRSLGRIRDVVRQELVARQLLAHLPPPELAPRVLDAGCGQGTQALRLARAGYDVMAVDMSEPLLGDAAAAAALEAPEVRARLRFQSADVTDLPADWSGAFDAVCCHGVLMYLPSLAGGLQSITRAVRPGGTVSVLTRNRAGIAMRAGMAGDWQGALSGFDARLYDNRIGVKGVRADEPEEVDAALRACGARPVAWYGVRLWTDHWPATDPPAELELLIEAEAEAGRRDPYRGLAALTHTLAVRELERS